jgi:hypothetical protein
MKSTRLSAWLLASLWAVASISCDSKRDPEPEGADLVQVRYAQTQCADKWGLVRGTQDLETTATAYLAQQGITLVNAHAKQESTGFNCNACTCGTGVVLTGRVTAAQLVAIQALGFAKQ